MASIPNLTRIYRQMARQLGGAELPAQKRWLEDKFLQLSSSADGGGFRATSDSVEGSTFTGEYEGSSAEDRTLAVLAALEEVQAEIAAAAAGTTAAASAFSLVPRIVNAPL
jgi:hypothetical protein